MLPPGILRESPQLSTKMSGRRLMNCSNCKQRHYAPSGAKCPYSPGQELPQEVLPLTDTESDASDLIQDEGPPCQDKNAENQVDKAAQFSESEFEFPSGQRSDPQPSTSQAARPDPITLQQFADATAGRMQALENERVQMSQTQATLQSQQQTLQASVDAIRLHLMAQPLNPNPDVRRKTGTKQADGSDTSQTQSTPNSTCPSADRASFTHHLQPLPPTLAQPPQPQMQTQLVAPPLQQQIRQQQGPNVWDSVIHCPTPANNVHQQHNNNTLAQLRTDTELMQQAARVIAANTQDNTDNGKPPKSGLKRDNAEQVCQVIPWPHEHVMRNLSKPPTYESLTLSEFAAGYMCILANIPNVPPQLTDLTNYLAELFDDTTDTDWQSARFAHRVVLQAIENGRADFD